MAMEREILLTGIGGQSIQLGAQTLARAAVHEDRHVMLLGTYGGTMRGGSTEASLVVGDVPLSSPPIVSHTWSALAMHHRYWDSVARKLRPGAVVLLNSTLFEAEIDRDRYRVFDVPASRVAAELGSPLAACLVLIGAFTSLSGLLSKDTLVAGMRDSVPPYRRQHLEANEKALRAGFELVPLGAAPAWREEAA
jgi:2-oxoglutarate ferredoxin oxidoreductase subunit gamma